MAPQDPRRPTPPVRQLFSVCTENGLRRHSRPLFDEEMKNSLSALDFFSAKIAYEMTPEDLATAQAMGASPVVVDTRSATAWSESRIPGALTIPSDDVTERAPDVLDDEDADIVLYSWGADDHTAARAAIALLKLGYTQVRELSGGFDAWQREGFAVETDNGRPHQLLASLDAPLAG